MVVGVMVELEPELGVLLAAVTAIVVCAVVKPAVAITNGCSWLATFGTVTGMLNADFTKRRNNGTDYSRHVADRIAGLLVPPKPAAEKHRRSQVSPVQEVRGHRFRWDEHGTLVSRVYGRPLRRVQEV